LPVLEGHTVASNIIKGNHKENKLSTNANSIFYFALMALLDIRTQAKEPELQYSGKFYKKKGFRKGFFGVHCEAFKCRENTHINS